VQPRFWVSNGAYTLRDWQPQAHVELSANPHFHDPAPLERVRYHPVVNEQSAYNRFRNGELHAIGSFPAGELDAVRRGAPAALHLSDLLSMMYLVFNVETGALADQRVRQALSMAIDQNMLTEKVLRNGSKPAYSFVPSMVSGYRAVELPHRDQSLSERQARARQLLQAAGFTPAKPLRLTLRHVNTLEGKKLNLAIAGMWQQAGVETTLLQADLRNHFAELRQGNFEVAWAGWIGENNAEHYLGLLQSDIGDVNYGRFADLEFDTLMAAAQKEASLTRRNAMLRDAEGAVIHHYAVVPLYPVAVRRLVDPKLQGWHDNNRDMHQARYLHF
jgi:oligopeptide transport system substrate-binding protein